jgi:DNA-binding response OmpR family regulator
MEDRAFRLLVIEDDPAVAQSLQDGLAREGYGVVRRSTGREGIEYARASHPHLVILDVRLPDGSGFDVCRAMRQVGLRQPILMLTVQSDEVDKILGLEMGADDYMTKPYSLRELVSRVRALLRRAYGDLAASGDDRLYIGDLVLDAGRGQAWRGQDLINLTPTEFRLLLVLARHAGRALTRAQLLDAAWGYAADVESERTVNVHIRRLREKIERDPARPALLLTVPGIGYRLVG